MKRIGKSWSLHWALVILSPVALINVVACVPETPTPLALLPLQDPWILRLENNWFKPSDLPNQKQQIIISPEQLIELSGGQLTLGKIFNFQASSLQNLYFLNNINQAINDFIKRNDQATIRNQFGRLFQINFAASTNLQIKAVDLQTINNGQQMQMQILASNNYGTNKLIPFYNGVDVNPQRSFVFGLKIPFSFINLQDESHIGNLQSPKIITTNPDLFKKAQATTFKIKANQLPASQDNLNWDQFYESLIGKIPQLYFGFGKSQQSSTNPLQQDRDFNNQVIDLITKLQLRFTIERAGGQIKIGISQPNILFLPDGQNNDQWLINYEVIN